MHSSFANESMKEEKKLAQVILRTRRKGFPSVFVYIVGKKDLRVLLYLAVVGLIFTIIWSDINLKSLLFLVLGIIIGVIVKEIAIFTQIRANWSFTEKVTDWAIVSELAGQEDGEFDG